MCFCNAEILTVPIGRPILGMESESAGLLFKPLFCSNVLLKHDVFATPWPPLRIILDPTDACGQHMRQPAKRSVFPQIGEAVERALKDENRSVLVDHLGAPRATDVHANQFALDR